MMAVLYTKAFHGHNRVWPTQACYVHAERVCEKAGMLLCMPPTQLSAKVFDSAVLDLGKLG